MSDAPSIDGEGVSILLCPRPLQCQVASAHQALSQIV